MILLINKLSRCVREYKKPAILSMVFIVLEVVMEVIIPLKDLNLEMHHVVIKI